MKKTRTAVLCMALTGVLALGAAAAAVHTITADLRPDIRVVADGRQITLTSADGGEVAPILYNGTTYLPVRAVAEALGKEVSWNGNTLTVTLDTPAGADAVTGATVEQGGQAVSGDMKSYEAQAGALEQRMDALEKGTWSWDTYRALERDTDALDGVVERAYERGTLARAQYKTLDDRLDRVDDRLDALEDLHEIHD